MAISEGTRCSVGKKGKQANKVRRATAQSAGVDSWLEVACTVVGEYFKTDPQCVEAAALLVEILNDLGVQASARPVAFFAAFEDRHGNPVSVATSRQVALDAIAAGEITQPDEVTEGDDLDLGWGGHVVVVAEQPGTLLDPTFRQFSYAGLADVSFLMKIRDTDPADGKWEVRSTRVLLRWILGEWYEGGDETYASLLSEWRPLARKVASMIRANQTADNINLAPSWSTIKTLRDLE